MAFRICDELLKFDTGSDDVTAKMKALEAIIATGVKSFTTSKGRSLNRLTFMAFELVDNSRV